MQKKIIKDKEWLNGIKEKIAFFGAAAKGCVYLNSLGVNIENFPKSYIVDDTKNKQNMFVPGTGFEVVTRDFLYDEQPENLIVLAHNFKDYIIKSISEMIKADGTTNQREIEIAKKLTGGLYKLL